MRIEMQRAFATGFFLDAAGLKKIYTIVFDQIRKTSNVAIPEITLRAKLNDGVIVETNSMNDILSLENSGSKKVKHLVIRAENQNDKNIFIQIEFKNADRNSEISDLSSIACWISLADEDLVLTTTSKIDSFLRKIKVFAISQIGGANSKKGILLSYIIILLSFFTVLSLISVLVTPKIFIIISFGIILMTLIWWQCFPIYNFHWGGYIAYYNRKRSIGSFLLITITVSTIVSVFANYISGMLGIK
jgi:hypothetical protein